MEFKQGKTIGRYRLVSRIGTGGFGQVWLVKRMLDGDMFALKACITDTRVSAITTAKIVERFQYESDVLRLLSGKTDSVPRFIESGACRGVTYYVMENLVGLMEGGYCGLPAYDLASRSEEKIQQFVLQLLDSVGDLHRIGWVHGDLKPSNLMQRGDNPRPVLVDFGSAHLAESESFTGKDVSISVLPDGRRIHSYTPGYADPAEDRHTVHGDIYAIGQIIRDLFQDDVPLVWGAIINKCLSRNKVFRYASVGDIKRDVENLDRARFREYRRLRISEIREEFRIQEQSRSYRAQTATWDELISKRQAESVRQSNEWIIDFRSAKRFNGQPVSCRISEPLCLPANTVLTLTGPGILTASISGCRGSILVLCNDMVLHNTFFADRQADSCVYVLTGGTYLNFPHITSLQKCYSFSHRVFRSMSAYTELQFGGARTIADLRRKRVSDARKLTLKDDWKKKLIGYMTGDGFVYYEGNG